MKTAIKILLAAICQLLLTSHICAQVFASAGNDVPKVTASGNSNQHSKEVTITMKNNAETPIYVFAGPKEEIRDPKVNTFGGLSLNKLYLKEDEVVCLISLDKKPLSCTVIKPGVTSVEVNSSGNIITSK